MCSQKNQNSYLKSKDSQQVKVRKGMNQLYKIEQSKRTYRIQKNSFQHINTNQKTLTAICMQDDEEPAVIKTVQKFDLHALVSYFEVKINQIVTDQIHVYLGLINKQTSLRRFPGLTFNSIGYAGTVINYCTKNRNDLVALQKSIVANDKYPNRGTVLGIGLNSFQKNIFFTFNGCMIAEKISLNEHPDWTQFYPCLCLSKSGEQLKFVFDRKKMKFNLDAYENRQKQNMSKQIYNTKCNISNSTIVMAGLVDQYLLFHGYSKTLQRLRQQRGDSYRKLKPLSFAKTALKLNEKETIRVVRNQEGQLKIRKSSQDKNQQYLTIQKAEKVQYKSQAQSQDSDIKYLTDQIPICKKLTEDQKDQIQHVAFRKYSDVRYQKSHKKEKIIDKKEKSENMFGQSNILNESDAQIKIENNIVINFLEKERLDILACIKEERIQEATKIMKQNIPGLLEQQFYVEFFLKGHIFLRKIKRQSLLSAVKYAKQEKSFQKYQNILFPTYNTKTQGINWIPFKQIFTLLTDAKSKQGCLKQKQFQIFAKYINQLIFRKLGYHQYSRLQTCMNHIIETSKKMQSQDFIGPALKFLE